LDPTDPKHPSAELQSRQIWYFDAGAWSSLPHDSSRITQLKRLHTQFPLYSVQARQAHAQGSVICAFVVSEIGKVESIWLLKPLGYGLDEAAVTALLESTYTPAKVDGHPVGEASVDVMNFTMGQ
jgi:TonB family protein